MNLKNLEYIEKNNPATKEEIDFAEKRINGVLPKVYKEFLRYANGMVLNLCVLYDTRSIVESYECNEFAEYVPGYISIGNDNGDRELIIKAEKGAVLCGFLDAAEIGISQPEEWFTKTIDVNIQSNLDANSKARARSWRLLKLEEAIAHREAGKYPISSDILDKTIDELKEILSAEK